MWLGERMTEKGIGNGISLIIFAGIVAGLPSAAGNTFRLMTAGEMSLFVVLIVVALMVAVLGFIVFVERGQRRIPIHYAKRMMGRKMLGGQTTHLPLRINTAGVIPPIFASSLLLFPATVANFSKVEWLQVLSNLLSPRSVVYNLLFIAVIIFFALLLHRHHLRSQGHRREHPEAGRLHPGHPSRRPDPRVHRPGPGPHHPLGRRLHLGHLRPAHDSHRQLQRALLLRRHLHPHRGGCGHGLHGPDRVLPDLPAIRRPHG